MSGQCFVRQMGNEIRFWQMKRKRSGTGGYKLDCINLSPFKVTAMTTMVTTVVIRVSIAKATVTRPMVTEVILTKTRTEATTTTLAAMPITAMPKRATNGEFILHLKRRGLLT